MSGIAALGTQLKFGTTPTAVVAVHDISGPSMSVDTIDVTAHDSTDGYREFVAGFIDSGEVSFSVNWNPDSATHKVATGGLPYLLAQRELEDFELIFPTGATAGDTYKASFSALVTAFEPSAPVEDKLSADITLKIDGPVTWATVAG